MPNIPSYRPPSSALDPDDRAQQAYETAGRRVGPLLNQAAADQRERGKLRADGIRNRIWPYDIIALNERAAAARAEEVEAKANANRVGFQVIGGSRSGGLALQGGNGTAGGGGSAGLHSRAGQGAGNFARMARQAAGGDDTDTGRSDSYYSADGTETVGEVQYGAVKTPKAGWNADAYKEAAKWYDGLYEQQAKRPSSEWVTDDQGNPMEMSTSGRGPRGVQHLDLTPYPSTSSSWGELASEGREHIQ